VVAIISHDQAKSTIFHLFTVKNNIMSNLPGAWCTLTDVRFVSPKLCSYN